MRRIFCCFVLSIHACLTISPVNSNATESNAIGQTARVASTPVRLSSKRPTPVHPVGPTSAPVGPRPSPVGPETQTSEKSESINVTCQQCTQCSSNIALRVLATLFGVTTLLLLVGVLLFCWLVMRRERERRKREGLVLTASSAIALPFQAMKKTIGEGLDTKGGEWDKGDVDDVVNLRSSSLSEEVGGGGGVSKDAGKGEKKKSARDLTDKEAQLEREVAEELRRGMTKQGKERQKEKEKEKEKEEKEKGGKPEVQFYEEPKSESEYNMESEKHQPISDAPILASTPADKVKSDGIKGKNKSKTKSVSKHSSQTPTDMSEL